VLTATDAGLLNSPDPEVLARSFAAGRVIVTHDHDYLQLHQQQQSHAGIADCEPGSRSIGQMVAGLTLIYEALTPGEMVGRVEFL
jgi:predicted nuclease of predicted toxin-antitoxin system